jgi:hypothetical protein
VEAGQHEKILATIIFLVFVSILGEILIIRVSADEKYRDNSKEHSDELGTQPENDLIRQLPEKIQRCLVPFL